MTTTDIQFQIDKLYEKARNSVNNYEKKMYFRKIELLKKGYCPTCEKKLE